MQILIFDVIYDVVNNISILMDSGALTYFDTCYNVLCLFTFVSGTSTFLRTLLLCFYAKKRIFIHIQTVTKWRVETCIAIQGPKCGSEYFGHQ
jgi:hypothetical protein